MSSSKTPASLRLPSARNGAVAGFVSTLGLAVAAVPAAVMAQTPPAAPAPEQLSPVTVSGDRGPGDYKVDRASSPKMSQPLLDTPKSVVIIPKELINEQGATNLKDVLRTTPGISLSTAEGGLSFGDRVLIRGFEARGDIFVDGMRDPGVTSREAFNVEQVEIVKGPGSVYSGRGTTGGFINLVTKQPLNKNQYAGDFTIGTDHTTRVTTDINQVIGDNVAIRFNGMWHNADVAGRDEVFTKRWGVAPSIKIGLNTATSFTLSYYHLDTDELPDYGIPFQVGSTQPMKVKRDNFYGLTGRDYRKTSADIATARLDHQFNDSIALRSQFRIGRTTNDYVASAPEYSTNPSPPPGFVNANAKSNNRWNKAIANQTDITAKFDTGTVKHSLIAGVEISREISRNRPWLITPQAVAQNLLNPNPNLPWAGTVVKNPQTFTKTTADSYAAYLFDNIKINETWEFNAGLRLDHYRVRGDANAFLPSPPAVPGTVNTANGLKNTSTFLNWQAGVVYHPMPNGSIYIAASSSSNPSGEQFDGGAADGGIAVQSVNLKPERNYSYEIGTKWDLLSERLQLTAALFRIDKVNARITGPGAVVQTLDGKARVDGFELGAIGKITNDWSVFGGFAILDSEIVKSSVPGQKGARFPNVAEVTFSMWSTYKITDKLTIGGLAYYSGPRYGGTFAAGNAHIPGYWRFDAMASYQLTDNVEVRLNILNITNKMYYDAIYRSGTPFAYVGPGRTALVTTAFKF